MRTISIFVFFACLAWPTFSYRFVCNGFWANGDERQDKCGAVCDKYTTARWNEPNVPITVSDEPRPRNISLNDWRRIVDRSFAAWNNVQGSGFRFFRTNKNSQRDFGSNSNLHEIFWITDKAEWRELVGAGEFGTLGATVPRYNCPDSDNPGRVIFDADLALNGMAHINWQVNCNNVDCIAVQTTLVHELGHFLGLDHPCLLCGSSIMSARAGYDLIEPMSDDEDGVRILYPIGELGSLGYPCQENLDCQLGLTCHEDKYCSQKCFGDMDCGANMSCAASEEGSFCRYSNNKFPGQREGQSCRNVPCQKDLVCAGTDKAHSFCFATCGPGSDCLDGKDCVNFDAELSICMNINHAGEECSYRDMCAPKMTCLFHSDDQGVCHTVCGKNGECGENEKCVHQENGDHLCFSTLASLNLSDGSTASFRGKKRPGSRLGDGEGWSCNHAPISSLVWFLGLVIVGLRRFRKYQ